MNTMIVLYGTAYGAQMMLSGDGRHILAKRDVPLRPLSLLTLTSLPNSSPLEIKLPFQKATFIICLSVQFTTHVPSYFGPG